MIQANPSSNSLGKFLLWAGLAGGLILAAFIVISLTQIIKKEEKAAGFPEFPTFPGAQLKSGVWEVEGSVPQVMDWYITTLSDGAWEIEDFPFDPGALGQQLASAIQNNRKVYLTIKQEDEDEPSKIIIEIVPKGFKKESYDEE